MLHGTLDSALIIKRNKMSKTKDAYEKLSKEELIELLKNRDAVIKSLGDVLENFRALVTLVSQKLLK